MYANIVVLPVNLRLVEALERIIWYKEYYQFQSPDRPIHHFSVSITFDWLI